MNKRQENIPFLSDGQLLARLENCSNLPSPPGIAMRVIDLARDPDVHINSLSDLICKDPALAAKVMRVANSPLYALRRKTENLRQAITLLGLNGTMSLALSFSLVSSLRQMNGNGLDYVLFWKRSLAAAICCRQMGGVLRIATGEELFLAGLLQDIGMLVLDKVFPELYRGVASVQSDHLQLQRLEQDALGTDHAVVGGWLLRRWGLSRRLQCAVSGSHAPESVSHDSDYMPMVRCTALAGQFADIIRSKDPHEAFDQVAMRAKQELGLGLDALSRIVESLNNDLREAANLYEINLDDCTLSESLLDQARETLMLRNLQVIQHATTLKETAQALESHAQSLEEQSRRDGLTGLYNRAYLDRVIEKEFEIAKKNGWPFAIIFVDLDHFKHVNDTYGHAAGDYVLTHTARILLQCTRDTDVVARFGGEEFVIILQGSAKTATHIVAERLVNTLRNHRYQIAPDCQLTVTASIGTATQGENEEFSSAGELLRAADKAVYAAKHRGRDRVVEYDESMKVQGAGGISSVARGNIA
jgi:diguanylate cyclase (GGDEF)-like protein